MDQHGCIDVFIFETLCCRCQLAKRFCLHTHFTHYVLEVLTKCEIFAKSVGPDSGVDTGSKIHCAASKVRDRIINKICMGF